MSAQPTSSVLARPPIRPLRSPHTERDQRRVGALVALALASTVAGGIAVVAAVGYEHRPDLVHEVNADPRLVDFTRLSDREVWDAARDVCTGLAQGATSNALARELSTTYRVSGAAGVTFVRTAASVQCPELADA